MQQPKPLDTSDYVRRIILNLMGRDKCGKSHFALTAPDWLLYCNFDKSSKEDVLQHPDFKGRFIETRDYWPEFIERVPTKGTPEIEANKAEAKRVLDRYRDDVMDALATQQVRTIVIDTMTEERDVRLVEKYGKSEQLAFGDNAKYMYAPVHSDQHDFVKRLYTSDKNVILVHKQKKQYLNGEWTGGYELAGYYNIPYDVQVNVTMDYEIVGQSENGKPREDFVCTVGRGSLGAGLRLKGVRLIGPLCNFQSLAMMVFPGTKVEDWK